jgi:hypothetical protein
MLHQDPNPESFAPANTALHHRGKDSKPAAAVTATAPSNIVIPPSLQAALDQMMIPHQQNVPPSAPHCLAPPPASCPMRFSGLILVETMSFSLQFESFHRQVRSLPGRHLSCPMQLSLLLFSTQ